MIQDTTPPSSSPSRPEACGRLREKPGAKARADVVEWKDPDTIAQVRELGQRIRWIRNALNMTQPELAALAKTSVHAVQAVEAGKPKDSCYHLAIARGLNCPVYKLWYPPEKWAAFVLRRMTLFEKLRKENIAKLELP